MIEREQSPFPSQLKPDRWDFWAIVFGAPKGPLFLNTFCTTQRPRYFLTYLLRPGIIFPQVLIEHCIYLFGIVQTSISLDSVNVCSSRSTSIWVTMLGLVDLKFYSTTMLQSESIQKIPPFCTKFVLWHMEVDCWHQWEPPWRPSRAERE